MHPSSLLSYYPTYSILDEILSKNNYKKLSIYIDLKKYTTNSIYGTCDCKYHRAI
jgi:hypothetical protein